MDSKYWIIGCIGALQICLASCSTLEIAGVGRPDPDLKTVHFALVHWDEGYTQEDYESHPDHDCNGIINYKNE